MHVSYSHPNTREQLPDCGEINEFKLTNSSDVMVFYASDKALKSSQWNAHL